jgi:BRCT domain type II-containing protein
MASTAEEGVVRQAVGALLRIWLNDTASCFQKAVASSGLPTPAEQGAITAAPGEVLFFADGLRYDVARLLQKSLEVMGITGSLTTLTRPEAKALAERLGAKVTDSVTRKTDLVVLGADAGSKARKAAELNVRTLSEAAFREMIGLG